MRLVHLWKHPQSTLTFIFPLLGRGNKLSVKSKMQITKVFSFVAAIGAVTAVSGKFSYLEALLL